MTNLLDHIRRFNRGNGVLALFAAVLIAPAASPVLYGQEREETTVETTDKASWSVDNEAYPAEIVSPPGTTVRTLERSYGFGDIVNWTGVSQNDRTLELTSNPEPEYCTDSEPVEARIVVDLMTNLEDHRFGSREVSFDVTFTIDAEDGNGVIASWTAVKLTLTTNRPHQRYITETVDLTLPGNVLDGAVKLVVSSVMTTATSGGAHVQLPSGAGTDANGSLLFESQVRLVVTYEEVRRRGAVRASNPSDPIVTVDPIGYVAENGTAGDDNALVLQALADNPVTFAWSHLWPDANSDWGDHEDQSCVNDTFANYQLQILRLFNRKDDRYNSPSTQGPEYITDTIDWNRALTLETGNSEQEVTLTLAEGSGWYVWRVRPIGSIAPGGAANDQNWGVWSDAPEQGQEVQLDEFGLTKTAINGVTLDKKDLIRRAFFYYDGFPDAENRIFSRTYSEGEEGLRFAEQMTYATPSLRSRQQHRRLQSTESSVVNETLYDLSGRPVLQTMAAPVPNSQPEWDGFEYKPQFVDYGPDDFDADATIRTPDGMPISIGGVAEYYSTANSDPSIPTAEGGAFDGTEYFPYSRTRYYPDASGRVAEQGGPGEVHRIGGSDFSGSSTPISHTVRTLYGPSSDEVLRSMFGHEAPDAEKVRAVYTVDPNKVTSIEYRNAAGKTIASFLARAENKYLDTALGNGEARIEGEELTYPFSNRLSVEDGIVYSQRLVVEVPGSDVTFRGSINPGLIDPCGIDDVSCTYRLQLEVYDADDFSETPLYSESAPVTPDGTWSQGNPITFSTNSGDAVNGPKFYPPNIGSSTFASAVSDPGTYLVVVRLMGDEPDLTDTYRRRPSEIAADQLAEALRDSIDQYFYDAIRGPLDEGDLDSIYRFIGNDLPDHLQLDTIPPSVSGRNDTILRVTSECWHIDVPVKKCEVFTCPATIEFEQMLYDAWKDKGWGEDPTKYFRFPKPDGSDQALYPSGTVGGFTNGAGAFDAMVQHMIDDPSNCWDCETLMNAWEVLVRTFGARATENGLGDYNSERRTDFNLMDEFFAMVGRKLEGTSTQPYGANGYLEHAYKRFNTNLIDTEDHEACIEQFDYDPGNPWSADNCDPTASTNKWQAFYGCITRGGRDLSKYEEEFDLDPDCFGADGKIDSNCIKRKRDESVDLCEDQCEQKRDAFERELRLAYFAAGYRVEGDTVTPYGEQMPDTLTVLSEIDFGCAVETAIDFCKSHCDLTIEWVYDPLDATRRYAGSIGTPTELALFAKPFGSRLKMGLGIVDSLGIVSCADTAMQPMDTISETGRLRARLRLLNRDFEAYREQSGDQGTPRENCEYVRDTLFAKYFPEAQNCVDCFLFTEQKSSNPSPSSTLADSCCPDADPENDLFTLNEHITGEFFVDYDSCTLSYRRWCTYADVTYQVEVPLCDSVCPDACAVDLCYNWVDTLEYPWLDEPYMPDCEMTLAQEVREAIELQINNLVDSSVRDFRKKFHEACSQPQESFELTKEVDYYHFTLFYYDRAGSLVRTVPPAGVRLLGIDTVTRQAITAHEMVTTYRYNSLSQMIEKETPDGGITRYVYDDVGRLRFSQDARQAAETTPRISYMKYDRLGRVIEAGEADEPLSLEQYAAEEHWYPAIADANADQRVFTYYTKRPETAADSVPAAWSTPDAHGESISGHYQRYTLNRVAHVIAAQKEEPDSLVESTYSYDPHGNVEWVRQELPLLGSNWVEYSYDLLSGNMLEMRYNPGWRDALWHRYFYDEDNRLTEVKTSREGEIWDSDARYSYYAHGPLKRAEYGEDSVQGIDYTYTLQGWLKGINHPQGALDLSSFSSGSGPAPYELDPGGDQAGHRSNYAPDAFGMTLRYHEGDFYRIGSAFHSEESTASDYVAATNLPAIAVNGNPTDLYNGNISTWTSHTVAAGGQVDETLTGHRYQYDVLNRLRLSRYEMWNGTSVAPQGARYRSVYTYDPNGNIQTLVRFGNGTTAFDDFTYTYPSSGSNRLSQVSDAAPGPTAVPGDLEGGQGSNNYTYDASGNLIGDAQELILSGGIEWRADGKVWRVTKSGGTPDELKFSYNASGDRVIKKVTDNGEERRLFYVREAGGKVLAVYEQVCPAPMVGPSGPNIDWDGDGQVGAFDPCPCEAPIDQYLGHQDMDEDGVPDECDPNPSIPGDLPSTDQDGDGNDDDHDNCMCTPNPSESGANGPQTDSDGDGFGDECDPGCEIALIELHVYGNGSEGRIAISQPSGITRSGLRGDTTAIDVAVQPLPPLPPVPPVWVRDSILTRVLDEKVYELKDHLGNVRVVTSDVKAPVSQSGEAPFAVTLRRYTNYYPFGMAQPGRSYEAVTGGEYRYGFNGYEFGDAQESSYLADDRLFDTKVARWLTIDPVAENNHRASSYSYPSSNPILFVDVAGRDGEVSVTQVSVFEEEIKVSTKVYIYGAGASASVAREMEGGANTVWNNGGKGWTWKENKFKTVPGNEYTVNVQVSIDVVYISSEKELNRLRGDPTESSNNFIYIASSDVDLASQRSDGVAISSTRGHDQGEWISPRAESDRIADNAIRTYIHEMGHLLGLPDLYKRTSEGVTTYMTLPRYSMTGKKLGETSGNMPIIPDPNADKDDIMLNATGTVRVEEIQEVVAPARESAEAVRKWVNAETVTSEIE